MRRRKQELGNRKWEKKGRYVNALSERERERNILFFPAWLNGEEGGEWCRDVDRGRRMKEAPQQRKVEFLRLYDVLFWSRLYKKRCSMGHCIKKRGSCKKPLDWQVAVYQLEQFQRPILFRETRESLVPQQICKQCKAGLTGLKVSYFIFYTMGPGPCNFYPPVKTAFRSQCLSHTQSHYSKSTSI